MAHSPNDILSICLAALIVRLREQGRFEGMCTTALMPGNAVTLDVECGGVVWVRLVQAFDSSSFPMQESSADVCATSLALSLEMGVMRASAPLVEAFGSEMTLPDDNDLNDAVAEQLADMMDMRHVIKRALPGEFEEVLIGAYSPLGPDGGSVGGSWTVTVGEDI